MRRVFADTLYWVAMIHRKDQWHQAAVSVSRTLTGCHLVTTDEVLTEVLAAFCEAGPLLRQRAVTLVRSLQSRANVTLLPQSRGSFQTGLNLYAARPDKDYSLTDFAFRWKRCGEGRRCTEILTHDNHFTQEGFAILL